MSTIRLLTEEPIMIEQRLINEDSDLMKEGAVMGTFVQGNLIGRALVPENHEGTKTPVAVPILYNGHETEDGSLQAALYGYIAGGDDDDDPEPWKGEGASSGFVLVFLGIIVRVPKDRKFDNLERECIDHFEAILNGKAVKLIDKLLEDL